MKRLTEDVATELSRFGPAAGMTRIIDAWPSAVGATLARNAWPARLGRDGTLHVHTSSSSWAFELAQLEADVSRRLRDALAADAPRRIRFVVGRLPEPGADPDEHASRKGPEPGPEEVARAAELAAAIDDEELREVVAKAAARSLLSARYDHPL